MANTFIYTPEQVLTRDIPLTAINGGVRHWARMHGFTVDGPPEQVRAEGVDILDDRSLWHVDLLADIDAAAAVAQALSRVDEAPSSFDPSLQCFFARVAAADAWSDKHGHFDCCLRSHASRSEFGGGRDQATEVCRPTTLIAELRRDQFRENCQCVGDLIYRGGCPHCAWDSGTRNDYNDALEDAHDHACPRWRDLPCVPRRPEPRTTSKQKATLARWADATNKVYPDGWLDSGGPIRTARGQHGTRHIPGHTGYGGYDLCGEISKPGRQP